MRRCRGVSTRTLARRFKAELGSSFLGWRQQVRVFAAIPRLNQSEAVARIAGGLGYDSAGAFATAFRLLAWGYRGRSCCWRGPKTNLCAVCQYLPPAWAPGAYSPSPPWRSAAPGQQVDQLAPALRSMQASTWSPGPSNGAHGSASPSSWRCHRSKQQERAS